MRDKMYKKMLFAILIIPLLGITALPSHGGIGKEVVLVTGFEPFGDNTVNPSMMIAERLNGTYIGDKKIYGISLPVIYFKSAEIVRKKMDELSPEIVICLGLDNSSNSIKVEKIAWNLIASLQPDNEGKIILFRPIALAPIFLFSNIPVMKIVEEIRTSNISVHPSFFAGTFICNEVFYETLLYGKEKAKIGFIHVPNIPSQNPNGMELDKMVEAVKIAILACT